MAFTDPLPNVTLATVAQTLPRTSSLGTKSLYRKADGSLLYTLSHQPNKLRVRSMARLDQFLDVNSDLILENQAWYLVNDRPLTGFTQQQVLDLGLCLLGSMTGSSNAAFGKIFGLET
jgi:hypothetical protein